MMYDTISCQPVIPADRFVLRPVRKSDAGAMALYAGDERVARSTRSIPHPLPDGVTEGFIQRALDGSQPQDAWVIDGALTEQQEVLGVVTLTRLDRGQSEMSYWVAPAFWNAGIASEAVRAMISANPLKNSEIFAEVFQDNPASARVLTNAGFEYIGDAESHCVARAANVPTWTYMHKFA
ncbi:GNAT family N-acetyltransferase [Aliiroseovarius lamellibrachiae]|uniref:GNAT family N-acetyltransferase n=1 Tax=Aliiroseovarius lamellibrachiae TaxID=1924933 RepID=UPI001BE09EEA|nr:GNAT family N-acetyltransferase [Aliiroseovarius lamellibrachiae]MBT2132165.1 GNAT family N-acetyltransferase [Aliiroseovarius lamellibrachiae]